MARDATMYDPYPFLIFTETRKSLGYGDEGDVVEVKDQYGGLYAKKIYRRFDVPLKDYLFLEKLGFGAKIYRSDENWIIMEKYTITVKKYLASVDEKTRTKISWSFLNQINDAFRQMGDVFDADVKLDNLMLNSPYEKIVFIDSNLWKIEGNEDEYEETIDHLPKMFHLE